MGAATATAKAEKPARASRSTTNRTTRSPTSRTATTRTAATRKSTRVSKAAAAAKAAMIAEVAEAGLVDPAKASRAAAKRTTRARTAAKKAAPVRLTKTGRMAPKPRTVQARKAAPAPAAPPVTEVTEELALEAKTAPLHDSPSIYNEEEVRQHLPLVRQVVQRMLPRKPPEVPTEDLLSWGVVGLLDAMRKYDPGREATFSTYAQYRIRGSILDYLRRCDWLPRSIRQKSHDLEEATLRLERRLGRQPRGAEIAAEVKMSMEEYSQTLAALGANTMIATGDVGFGRGEESLTADDVLSDASENGPMKKVLRKERVEILAKCIEQLPDKERIVVSFYYFEGLTMREMAEALHLTEGRISQLHSQAMGRMRGMLSETKEEISVDS